MTDTDFIHTPPTLEQQIEYLKNEFMFSSSGVGICVSNLIEAYEALKNQKQQPSKQKIVLPEHVIEMLTKTPEKSQGCHYVDVFLKNGSVLLNQVVLNSSILVVNEIPPTEIVHVTVSR